MIVVTLDQWGVSSVQDSQDVADLPCPIHQVANRKKRSANNILARKYKKGLRSRLGLVARAPGATNKRSQQMNASRETREDGINFSEPPTEFIVGVVRGWWGREVRY